MSGLKRSHLLPAVIVASAGLTGFLILAAPALPAWGARHTPHVDRPPLRLSSDHALEQTFRFEYSILDRVVLWVDMSRGLPAAGGLALDVQSPSGTRTAVVPFADIPPSGLVAAALQPSLRAAPRTESRLKLRLTDPGQTIGVMYQIASGIYADGGLWLDGRDRPGYLAFQLRYRRPPLEPGWVRWGYAGALLIAGIIVALALARGRPATSRFTRRDIGLALACGVAVFAFYGWHLLGRGVWVGPTDFSKDAAYLASAADALRAGAWPTWSHRTCGGMALLGNPEGNTVSLGALLATALPPDTALLALLSVEAALSAAGTVLLARYLGGSITASIGAAVVASVSASFAYRIMEGLTPVGGAVAFLPWAVLFLLRAVAERSGWWAILSGTAAALMFLRGDVHVVVGALIILALLCVFLTAARRSAWPLAVLAVIGASFFLWSSIKILPYLEQPRLISHALPPYVVPLAREGALDDALFRTPDRSFSWKPLHDRRFETWGNFGGHVGVLAVVFGGIGLLTRGRARVVLSTGTVAAFLLSEGGLFEELLRRLGPLSTLLRMPSRLFSIFALFLGLLTATGIDRVRRDFGRVPRAAVSALILAALIFEVGGATHGLFLRNLQWHPGPPTPPATEPLQVAHEAASPDHVRHATALARTGYLLPKICGDQNNPPAFITRLTGTQPLANVPSAIRPNQIILRSPPGTADITIRSRFTSSWRTSSGTLLESADGGLHLTLPAAHPDEITLTYQSATMAPQAVLAALLGYSVAAAARAVRTRRRAPAHPV